MALDTLITSTTYDSFFEVAEMEAFITQVKHGHGGGALWEALDAPAKEEQILIAVAHINSKKWLGTLNETVVAPLMSWPRDPYGDPATPGEIGRAMACHILKNLSGTSDSSQPEGATGAIQSKTVGNVSVTYDTTSAGAVQPLVETCIDRYAGDLQDNSLASAGGIGGVGLSRLP